jgi:hypothetical protein
MHHGQMKFNLDNFFATNMANSLLLFTSQLVSSKLFYSYPFCAGMTIPVLGYVLFPSVELSYVAADIHIQAATFWTRLLFSGSIYTLHVALQSIRMFKYFFTVITWECFLIMTHFHMLRQVATLLLAYFAEPRTDFLM